MPETLSAPPSPKPVDIGPAVESVRKSGEFEPPQPESPLASLKNIPEVRAFFDWLQDAIDALMNQLQSWFSQLDIPIVHEESAFLSNVYTYTVMGLLIFISIVLLYITLSLIRRLFVRSPAPPQAPRTTADGTELLNSQRHLQQAQALAQTHAYNQAIHQLYLAMLCHLDETHIVPFETTRTNLEYLAVLKHQPAPQRAESFGIIARAFESVHYGRQTKGESDYRACQSAYGTSAPKATPSNAPDGSNPHV